MNNIHMNTFLDPSVPFIKLFAFEHLWYVSIITSMGLFLFFNRKKLKEHQKNIRILLFTLSLF